MTWQIIDSNYEQAKITVIGVGGGGGNSVNHIIKSGIKGVEFICANTDSQDLSKVQKAKKIKLGEEFTKGLGAGNDPERGISFQKDGPLDMRFNRNQELTCSDIIENYSESELSEILWKLGEEEESRRIAKFIVERREVKKFKSTTDLANVIKLAKRKRTKKHSATKSFQALRMAVNSELESLSKCLEVLKNKLKKSGKIVVISFHSLEDRIAKQSFKTQPNLVEKKIPIFNDTTREKFTVSKVLLPTNDEISMNPRSRSAKMRVIKKL